MQELLGSTCLVPVFLLCTPCLGPEAPWHSSLPLHDVLSAHLRARLLHTGAISSHWLLVTAGKALSTRSQHLTLERSSLLLVRVYRWVFLFPFHR
jgi:hypothetical protein